MPETKAITDAELVKQIKTSNLDERQKTELADLVSEMTAEERDELLGLIYESNELAREKYKKLAALNEEYKRKMGEAAHEESEYAREEFEKLDKNISAGEIKDVEAQIAGIQTKSKTVAKRVELVKGKKHALRNVMLVIFLLILIAGGILLGLNYL